jgi:sulfopyruvate decarboxylase alpha subunit
MPNVPHDWPAEIYAALAEAHISQIAYVPDAGLTGILERCAADPSMRDVLLSSEQEGIAMLAGAWLGGERGALLMQSSGVGNCINALSLVRTCRFPLLALVTMRGEWGEFNPWQVPMGQSTADHLERAGVIVRRIEAPEQAGEMVRVAASLAFETQSAVAVLLSQRLIGAKKFHE